MSVYKNVFSFYIFSLLNAEPRMNGYMIELHFNITSVVILSEIYKAVMKISL